MHSTDQQFIRDFLTGLSEQLKIDDNLLSNLDNLANVLLRCSSDGHKAIIAGNGASSSIASHVSIDLSKGAGVRCINFNEPNLITCFSNDYGYENWVEKAIETYGDPGDVFIAISSSGQSKNILNGCTAARTAEFDSVITLSGFRRDNPLRSLGNINLWVNSNNYNIIENIHQIWLLTVVELIIDKKRINPK